MAENIGWFYAMQGVVSIFMPALAGIVADRWLPAQKVLSICHTMAGALMLAAGVYGLSTATPEFATLFTLYSFSVAFFMPTIALSNSTFRYGMMMADYGLETAAAMDAGLANGINIYAHKCTNKNVADSLGLEYVPAAKLMN
jgi:hypothetical protein